MPVYNGEMFVKDAIESTLQQSFDDFEFIIVDDGSTDKTLSIIRSYKDKRIKLIENKHDFIGSLNLGMNTAQGTYIARMDADDVMHIDRLKIQYAIMEENPTITVCGTWMKCFGENIQPAISRAPSGLIETPLLKLTMGCFMSHPTVMIRTDFLRKHGLMYDKNYVYAEDFKFWLEIAKKGGVFYVEPQPLMFYRISDQQVSTQKREEQTAKTKIIIQQAIDYLVEKNEEEYPELFVVFQGLNKLQEKELITT
jgi:glycosyltransferase involved in cell wall biosynthesis